MTVLVVALAMGLASPPPGLVVESVEPGYAGAMAGVRPGDVLLTWREQTGLGRHGTLRSPFDLLELEHEALMRGPVTLEGRRGDRPVNVSVQADTSGLGLETHPSFPADVGRLYEAGRRRVARGNVAAGVALWREAADRLANRDRDAETARCSLLVRVARAWDDVSELAEERQAFAEAFECVEPLDPAWLASLVMSEASLAMQQGELDASEDGMRVALQLQDERAPSSLATLRPRLGLAALSIRRGRLEDALAGYQEVEARLRAELPGSLALAQVYDLIGWVHLFRGANDEAEQALRRGAEIAEKAGPDSPTWSELMANLGRLHLAAGSADAERYFRLVYERQRRVAPEHVDTVRAMINMGACSATNGDVAASRRWHERALEMARRPAVWTTIAYDMRAVLFANIAIARAESGRGEASLAMFRQAIREVRRSTPGWAMMAAVQSAMGRQLARLGRHDEALDALYAGVDHGEAYEPGSGAHGTALLALADVALAAGDLDVAEEAYTQAAPIVDATMPLAPQRAQVRAGLGQIALRRRRSDLAEVHLRAALEAIESSRQLEGRTDDARTLFASGLYGIYQDLVDLLAAQGRTAEAFAVLEQSHARALLALLAERRLLEVDVPPEVEAERKRNDAAFDQAQEDVARSSAGAERAAAEARLLDARDQQKALAARLRARAPGMASFRYPEPLGAEEVAAHLDPGTLLIAYSVGTRQALAFALTAPGGGAPFALRAAVLPVDAAVLRRRALDWRRRVEAATPDPAIGRESRALYDLLLRPFAPELARARRLVVVPDGPLHGLPFAALHDGRRFVAAAIPSSVAPSGTLAARWMEGRHALGGQPPILFADPGGDRASLLPGSRKEASAIARLFPGALVHMGAEASEERAKALPRGARFVHFAVHGVIDTASPLDSGLALRESRKAAAASENGLLQAWEIVERVRVDTDLVTLSACRSADGPERAGEGTMGLVRAFQYAGARSVLASLWAVDDHLGATFMRRFYTELAEGANKAEALRAAQRAAIGEGWPPGRWASFQLYGDWK